MKAVITVVGHDTVGILHRVSGVCAQCNANVVEVTQSVLQDLFAMFMMIDIRDLSCDFAELSAKLTELGKELDLTIHVMHEDIFNSMHRI